MKNKNIVVLGAGAAGVIAALTLKRLGYTPIVLHHGIFKPIPFLETIPSQSISTFKKLGIEHLLLHPKHEKNFGQRYKWHQQNWEERNSIYEPQGHGYTIHTQTMTEQLLALLSDADIPVQIHKVTAAYLCKEKQIWTLTLDHQDKLSDIDFIIDCTAKNNVLSKALDNEKCHIDQIFGCSLLIGFNTPHRLFQQSYAEKQASNWNFFLPYQQKYLYIQHFHQSPEQLKESISSEIIQSFLEDHQINLSYSIVYKQNFSSEISFHPTPAGEKYILAGDAAISFNPISSYGRTLACGSGYYAAMACHEILLQNQSTQAIESYQYLMMSHVQQHLRQLEYLYENIEI